MSSMSLNMMSFSPRQLFNGGEQGVWYDPSDMSTMFQDAAGTTVTAVEQPVGLILDKSKGLVVSSTDALGGNGNFSNASYWQDVNGVSTISGGQLSFNGSATLGGVWSGPSNNPVTIGRFYQVTFDVVSISSGGIRVWLGTGQPAYTATTAGSHTYRGACTGDVNVRIYNNGAATTAVVDNVVIRELPGNHASQATDASRPVLSARVNELTYSEQFDNAAWLKGSLTVSANTTETTDPLGGNTADKLQETATTAEHYVVQGPITLTAAQHTFSVYLKAAERTWATIYLSTGGFAETWFNLAPDGSGAPGTVASGFTASSTYVGNGWYRCSITRTTTAGTWYVVVNPSIGNGISAIYAGTLNSGIYVWGADLRVANVGVGIPAYQRVATATDYNTSGFPLYLKFDGVDDSLATASIDFTATDKMSVFAGVRKLSDVGAGVIAELSNDAGGNNGAFNILASTSIGDGARRTWGGQLRGTVNNSFGGPTYVSPISGVITQKLDIAGAAAANEIIQLVNGSATTLTFLSADSGTGNFGNYPLYVGRRNNASFPFNGHLYSLIVRGAASTTGQITDTEGWINSSTRAY